MLLAALMLGDWFSLHSIGSVDARRPTGRIFWVATIQAQLLNSGETDALAPILTDRCVLATSLSEARAALSRLERYVQSVVKALIGLSALKALNALRPPTETTQFRSYALPGRMQMMQSKPASFVSSTLTIGMRAPDI
jgi:hypothetical protein